jgi:hypothetical protein
VSPSANPDSGPSCGHTNSSSADYENDEVFMTRPRYDRSELSADKTTGKADDRSVCSLCVRDYAYDLKTSTGAKVVQCSFCYLIKCEGVVDDLEEGIHVFKM